MARLVYPHRAEGFGLIRKSGGNNCPVPGSDVRVSCDIVLYRPTSTYCDVLVSAPDDVPVITPGPSKPTWCAGEPGDMANFFIPPDPGGTTVPPIEPPTNPPATGVTRAELDAAIAKAIQALKEELEPELGAILDRVDTLEARPLPDLTPTIASALAAYQVCGKTESAFAHQHRVCIAITKR